MGTYLFLAIFRSNHPHSLTYPHFYSLHVQHLCTGSPVFVHSRYLVGVVLISWQRVLASEAVKLALWQRSCDEHKILKSFRSTTGLCTHEIVCSHESSRVCGE